MTDDRGGSNVLGVPAEAGGMPRVCGGSHSGIASDTFSDPMRHGSGRPGWGTSPPHTHTPQGGPDLPGLLPKTLIEAPLPGSRVPGRGIKLDQPQDSLCAPPRAGYNCDPGGS